MKKLKTFLRQVTPIVEAYGNKSILADIESAIERTEQTTSVLFCGEFKRGKSSLVNAIIGDNLCPTDIGIATSVITTIKYGAVKKAIRYYGNILENPDSLKSEEIEWSDIEKYTTGDVLDIDNTILVELSYPSPFLKNGIIIIDTPGIGGLDPRHAVLTHTALPKADVIVFVTDAGEPLTESELDFYENKVLSTGKPNIVLVNKADILTDETLNVHVATTKSRLAKFGVSNTFPVSAKYWNRYIVKQDEKSLLRSNKESVLTGITLEIEASKKQQCKQFRDMLVATLQTVSYNISLEVEQLKKDSTDKQKAVEELQNQLSVLSRLRGDLSNPNSQIRLDIDSIFENASHEVNNLISIEGTKLTSTELDALLKNEKGLENDGKWLTSQLNDRLRNISCIIDNKIDCAFKEIQEKVQIVIEDNIVEEKSVIQGDFKQLATLTSQLTFSLVGKLSLSAGLIFGAVNIGIVTTVLPLVAVVAAAATLIWCAISEENAKRKETEIRQQLVPKINLAITDLRNNTVERFSQFRHSLLSTLQTIISEMETKMKELQNSIVECRTNDQKCKEKIADLENKIKYCETTIAQMNLLYTNPFTHA